MLIPTKPGPLLVELSATFPAPPQGSFRLYAAQSADDGWPGPPLPVRKALLAELVVRPVAGPQRLCERITMPAGAELLVENTTGAEYELKTLGTPRPLSSRANFWKPTISGRAPAPSPKQTVFPRQLTRVNVPGKHVCNPAIFKHEGRTLFAYRRGWLNSRLHLAELGEDLQPIWTRQLHIGHALCRAGQEDPRLFTFQGKLRLSFIGVEVTEKGTVTHELLATLTDSLRIKDVWSLEFAGRQFPMEKNWTMFEADGLYAVYSIDPHRVLKIDGAECVPFARTSPSLNWSGGHLRGGASPVRVGGEFYHFFHGAIEYDNLRRYNIGVYTFAASPPFKPLRMTPAPIHLPDDDRPADCRNSVTFPCGAILDGDRWLVSAGTHDHWCDVLEFDREELERALVPIA